MLFSYYELHQYLNRNTVKGVVHVGAHLCEELQYYHQLEIPNKDIFWVEANPETVYKIKNLYLEQNILQGLCTDKTGDKIDFMITKNIHNNNSTDSSSIFSFGTHSKHHPQVVQDRVIQLTTIKLDDLLLDQNTENADLLNLDVQGAELLVCKGATELLKRVKFIYTEINKEELYKGCVLIDELDNYLINFGFKRVLTKWTEFNWGDALYVKG
jgi:FkbM family methyltransferase